MLTFIYMYIIFFKNQLPVFTFGPKDLNLIKAANLLFNPAGPRLIFWNCIFISLAICLLFFNCTLFTSLLVLENKLREKLLSVRYILKYC